MTRIEPTQQRATATRDTLINHALSLVLRNGVENVTTSDITKAAGVSVGVFYRYFENMGDVLWEFGLAEGQGVSRIAAQRARIAAVRREADPEVPANVQFLIARLDFTSPEDADHLVVLASVAAQLATMIDDITNPKEN